MGGPKFQSIQSLRFFAAFLVVLAHIEERLQGFGKRYHFDYHQIYFSGAFGVDIFFVISGFIMAWLAMRRFGESSAPREFVSDRLTRIVPLYWICTVAAVGLALAASYLGDPDRAAVPSATQLLKSLFFIPYLNEVGKHRPVMGQGWTLDFEMMFYALLTGCLLLRPRAGFIVLYIGFAMIFAAGHVAGAPEFLRIWADPIIFEFLAGVTLALVRFRFGEIVPWRIHPVLLAVPVAAFTVLCYFGLEMRLLNAAFSTLLVAMCVLGRDQNPDALSRATARVGDWSYSLYLTHGFVLLLIGIVWRKVFGAAHLWAYPLAVVAGAIPLSYLSFTYVEVPVTKLLRRNTKLKPLRGVIAIP